MSFHHLIDFLGTKSVHTSKDKSIFLIPLDNVQYYARKYLKDETRDVFRRKLAIRIPAEYFLLI